MKKSVHFFFYKQPGCLALTRKFCPKIKQLAKQPLRVKEEIKFSKNNEVTYFIGIRL